MRWSRLRAEPERGMTLMELLVAMSLLAIVMTLITMLVVSVSQTFTREESQHDSSGQAALGMQQLTRIIHAGIRDPREPDWKKSPVFTAAGADSMTLHSYINVARASEGPTLIRLVVQDGELVETHYSARRSAGVWVYQSSPSRQHVIAREVESLAFTYIGSDGNPLPLTGSGVLADAQRGLVAAVRVRLAVQTSPGDSAQAAVLESVVSLPNLNLTRVEP